MKVTKIIRLHNSKMGNPRFELYFNNGQYAKTLSDAMCSYAIHYGMIGREVNVIFKQDKIVDISEGL